MKNKSFLITGPVEGLSKEEQSKVKILFIRNALNKYKPGRIIAVSPTESNTMSWKEVYRIHLSDITKSSTDYDNVVGSLFTQLSEKLIR